MAIATLVQSSTGKWEAIFNNAVIVSSRNKDYVASVIRNGFNQKAVALGITDVVEGEIIEGEVAQQTQPEIISFSVDQRFQFLHDYVDMVARGQRKSSLIVGEGGLGKSFTVMNVIKQNGLPNIADIEEGALVPSIGYIVVKGYTTPKGLFRTLYENRHPGRIVIFDDCDAALRNDDSANLLKAALDSYDRRVVTWNAETPFGGESDLPKSFEFEGGVIFISNMSLAKMPQALLTRAAPIDVSMTRSEVVQRMRTIVMTGTFLPEIEMDLKIEAVDFIDQYAHHPQVKALNLRTLIGVVTNRLHKPDSWQNLSLNEMINTR